MRSRIYAVPVFKRHWAFCVQSHKSRNPIKSAADSVNSIAESSQPSSRDSNTTSTRTSWSHRVQTIVQKTTNKVKKEWEEIETAQPGTFKYNLAQISKEILSRQDPIESFLKDVSLLYDNDNDDNNRAANTTSTLTKPQLEVVYPSSLDERLIRRRIRLIANKRLKQHMYWGLASAALIPLSAALTIIPGPNVVLAYNAFRLYSHYKAYNGAKILGESRLVFQKDEKLDELANPVARSTSFLDDATVERIADHFSISRDLHTYVMRTRNRIARQQKDSKRDNTIECNHEATQSAASSGSRLSDLSKPM